MSECLLNDGHPQAEKIKMAHIHIRLNICQLDLVSSGSTIIQQERPSQGGQMQPTSLGLAFPYHDVVHWKKVLVVFRGASKSCWHVKVVFGIIACDTSHT